MDSVTSPLARAIRRRADAIGEPSDSVERRLALSREELDALLQGDQLPGLGFRRERLREFLGWREPSFLRLLEEEASWRRGQNRPRLEANPLAIGGGCRRRPDDSFWARKRRGEPAVRPQWRLPGEE